MTTITVAVDGIDQTFTDDDDPNTGLGDGGFRTRLMPLLRGSMQDLASKKDASDANALTATTQAQIATNEAQEAADSAADALASKNAAKTSEDNAAESATAAANSATAAASSAGTATTKASEASASALLAVQYAGAAGGAIPAVRLTWDTATADADPGTGKVRANNAALAAATALYVDNLDGDGNSITTVLDRWGTSTNSTKGTLRIAHRTNVTKWFEYQVTGSVVDGTGYRKITVSGGTGPGGFVAGDSVAVGFSRAGDMPSSFSAGTASVPGWAVTGDPDTGLAQIGGANTLSLAAFGAEVLRAIGVSGGVNYLRAIAGTSGVSPTLAAGGETNASLMLASLGTGSIGLRTGGDQGPIQAVVQHIASAVNYLRLRGGAAGHGAQVLSSTDRLVLGTSDGNSVVIVTNGDEANIQLMITHTAGATKYITLSGSASGDASIGTNSGAMAFNAPAKAKQGAIAYASTLTLDFTAYQDFVIGDLTGPLTLANPSTYPVGQRGEILLHEDTPGGRTVSFGANWIRMGNGTVNTAAGKYSVITYWIVSSSVIIYSIAGGA